jgi:cyclophilin family peptidyl-prolyl cis-trans isomerase
LSTSGKGAKRQRQKDQRRAKIEQQLRERKAKRRRNSLLLSAFLTLGIFGILTLNAKNAEKKPAPASACDTAKPASGNTKTSTTAPPMTLDPAKTYTAVVDTSCGQLEIALDAVHSPNTVNSFIALANQGFFNGLKFHRIVKGFAIQGGDPKGDGSGGPDYRTVDVPPAGFKYVEGTVAMAKAGNEPPGSGGSQFFIVPGSSAESLPAEYAVLGTVVKGTGAVVKLNAVVTKAESAGGEKSTPVKPVYIKKISIR